MLLRAPGRTRRLVSGQGTQRAQGHEPFGAERPSLPTLRSVRSPTRDRLLRCVAVAASTRSFARIRARARTSALTTWLRVTRRRASRSRVLLIAPTNPGSMGDEAMLQAATGMLRGAGATVDIGSAFSGRPWDAIEGAGRSIDLRRVTHDQASLLRTFAEYEHVLLIGADVMDGYYSEERSVWRARLVQAAARVARHAAVVGFSWSDAATPGSINVMRRLGPRVELWRRDPISRERLAGIVAQPVGLSADIAFLLEPRDPAGTVASDVEWIRARRSLGPVVGINLARTAFLDHMQRGLTPDALVERFAAETRAILDTHPTASMVIIPHDWRTDTSDLALGERLQATVHAEDPASRDRLRLVAPEPPTAAALKLVAGMSSVVVSSRMHLAIAALGSGTPAATLAYQGKTEGLFQHVPGLGDWSIDPSDALIPGTIASWVARLLERETESRAAIDAALPTVRRLASMNLPPPTGQRRAS